MTVRTKFIFIVLLFLLFDRTHLCAAPRPGETKAKSRIPRSVVLLQPGYSIVVEKSTQRLMLYETDSEETRLISTYRCSTGQNRGDKLKSGDKKTPEGIYFFERIYEDRRLEPRYGVMAFVLDFPNYLDRMEGKGGYGIWLHGLDRPLVPYDSKGCIAMVNRDIMELSEKIKLFQTPIIIEEHLEYHTPEETRAQREQVLAFLDRWERSWESKNLETYLDCYSRKSFKAGQWNSFKRHKQSLNESYRYIDVEVEDVNIFNHQDTVVVKFIQDYASDRFSSVGLKKLYLQKNSEALKIVGEDWEKVPKSVIAGHSRSSSSKRQLQRFLEQWVAHWENKRIERYMSCYSKKFRYKNMGWRQWKDYKEGINRSNRTIQVIVRKPQIRVDGDRATVTFVQEYLSDSYTDYGKKKLQLVKERDQWKIISEVWEPL